MLWGCTFFPEGTNLKLNTQIFLSVLDLSHFISQKSNNMKYFLSYPTIVQLCDSIKIFTGEWTVGSHEHAYSLNLLGKGVKILLLIKSFST